MRCSVETVTTVIVTAVVGGIGAAVGFTHTHDAAVRHGQSGWIAWAVAVVVECMVIVAGLHFVRDLRTGRRTLFPACVLVAAFVVQMGSQVSGAPATAAGWLYASLPSLACLTCVKLWMRSAGEAQEVSSSVPTDTVPRIEVQAPVEVPDRDPVRPVATWPPAA